jgi:hypothetical protein
MRALFRELGSTALAIALGVTCRTALADPGTGNPLLGGVLGGAVAASSGDEAASPEPLDGTGPGGEEGKVVVERTPTSYGVGLRLRRIVVPQGFLELFAQEAASGVQETGLGVELIRRKGNFEISLGVEYERLQPEDGLWLEKGHTPGQPGQNPDYVEFRDFGWLGVDLTFAWQLPLHEMVALRYGAGLGLGFVRGDVLQTDTECTGSSTDSCTQIAEGTAFQQGLQYKDPAELPPVFPVINLLAGAQVRPVKRLAINLEAGMRTVFYFGLTTALFF